MDNPFDDLNRKINLLYEQLAVAPVLELTGIVNSTGAGSGWLKGQESPSLNLSFHAWRIGSGPIRTESLSIRRRIADEELQGFQELIRPETIIRIRARLVEQNAFHRPEAQLEEILAVNPADRELQDLLTEWQKPVTRRDDRFGTLAYDRTVSWFRADVEWNGTPIELSLDVSDSGDPDGALRIAYTLWEKEEEWKERIEDYAVQKLLPLNNDIWREPEEAEITPEDFKRRMTLESVLVHPDGSFEFWHNDGDLFWGHMIQISGNLSDGPTNADIVG